MTEHRPPPKSEDEVRRTDPADDEAHPPGERPSAAADRIADDVEEREGEPKY